MCSETLITITHMPMEHQTWRNPGKQTHPDSSFSDSKQSFPADSFVSASMKARRTVVALCCERRPGDRPWLGSIGRIPAYLSGPGWVGLMCSGPQGQNTEFRVDGGRLVQHWTVIRHTSETRPVRGLFSKDRLLKDPPLRRGIVLSFSPVVSCPFLFCSTEVPQSDPGRSQELCCAEGSGGGSEVIRWWSGRRDRVRGAPGRDAAVPPPASAGPPHPHPHPDPRLARGQGEVPSWGQHDRVQPGQRRHYRRLRWKGKSHVVEPEVSVKCMYSLCAPRQTSVSGCKSSKSPRPFAASSLPPFLFSPPAAEARS